MSVFETTAIACPSCGAGVEVELVHSVNAVRRPDLRAAILDRSFQSVACAECGTTFRVEPMFTYLDVKRKQFVAALPASELPDWKAAEARHGPPTTRPSARAATARRSARRCRRAAPSAGSASTRS